MMRAGWKPGSDRLAVAAATTAAAAALALQALPLPASAGTAGGTLSVRAEVVGSCTATSSVPGGPPAALGPDCGGTAPKVLVEERAGPAAARSSSPAAGPTGQRWTVEGTTRYVTIVY